MSHVSLRTLLLVGALVLGTGCVSQATYEEAHSAVEVEREAHRRAELELQRVERDLAALRADLGRREAALAEQERKLAEADLSLKLAHQERDENGQLVDQLRGELARVGDHLRVYSEEKQRLSVELLQAEQRSKNLGAGEERLERLVAVVRDLSLLESQAITTGSLVLASDGGAILVRVPRATLTRGSALSADAEHLMKSFAELAKLHPEASFTLSERGRGGEATDDAALLRKLSDALVAGGVAPSSVSVEMAERGATPEGGTDLPDATADASGEAEVVCRVLVDAPVASQNNGAGSEPPSDE